MQDMRVSRKMSVSTQMTDYAAGTTQTACTSACETYTFADGSNCEVCTWYRFIILPSPVQSRYMVQSPRRAFRGNRRKRGEWHRRRLLNKPW